MAKGITFEDGSNLVFTLAWRKAIAYKYGVTVPEYWEKARTEIRELWEAGEIISQDGGVVSMLNVFDDPITMAEHAHQCIAYDLQTCLAQLEKCRLNHEKEKTLDL